jgi:hypothetical protein
MNWEGFERSVRDVTEARLSFVGKVDRVLI